MDDWRKGKRVWLSLWRHHSSALSFSQHCVALGSFWLFISIFSSSNISLSLRDEQRTHGQRIIHHFPLLFCQLFWESGFDKMCCFRPGCRHPFKFSLSESDWLDGAIRAKRTAEVCRYHTLSLHPANPRSCASIIGVAKKRSLSVSILLTAMYNVWLAVCNRFSSSKWNISQSFVIYNFFFVYFLFGNEFCDGHISYRAIWGNSVDG